MKPSIDRGFLRVKCFLFLASHREACYTVGMNENEALEMAIDALVQKGNTLTNLALAYGFVNEEKLVEIERHAEAVTILRGMKKVPNHVDL